MERLEALVSGCDLRYFRDPQRDALLLGVTGMRGSYQFLVLLEVGGEFLQFRTMRYHSCPKDHPHVAATLELLGALNYQLRFVKFGWDPSDGEIVLYGDMWMVDGDPTQEQLRRMFNSYMAVMDLNHPRIGQTIQTGADPGEMLPPEWPPPPPEDGDGFDTI
jgi:hypothetical protein